MSSCTSTDRIPDEIKEKKSGRVKNSMNDDKPKANAQWLNRKVKEGAGCISA